MRRRALFGWMVVLPAQPAFGQSDDMRSLRGQVLQILRHKYPELQARAGKDPATIEIEAAGNTGTVDVTNLQATLRQLPVDERHAEIDAFVDRLGLDAPPRLNKTLWADVSK